MADLIYDADGVACHGYLALPEGDGPFPGVLVSSRDVPCLLLSKDLGDELIGKIRKAMLEIDGSTDEGKKILSFMKAGKFVEADMKDWDGIRNVMESGVDIGG